MACASLALKSREFARMGRFTATQMNDLLPSNSGETRLKKPNPAVPTVTLYRKGSFKIQRTSWTVVDTGQLN